MRRSQSLILASMLGVVVSSCSSGEEIVVSRARLLNESGLQSKDQGDLRAAEIDFSDALNVAEHTDDQIEKARALNNLALIAELRGHLKEAVSLYKAALELNRRLENTERDQFMNAHNLANAYFGLNQIADARAFAEDAAILANDLGDNRDRARALNVLGVIDRRDGDFDSAYEKLSEALILFELAGDPEGQGTTELNLGVILEKRGMIKDAMQRYSRSLSFHQDIGLPEGIGASLEAMGRCYEQIGQPENALFYFRRATDVHIGIGNIKRVTMNLQDRIRIHQSLGQLEEVSTLESELTTLSGSDGVDV